MNHIVELLRSGEIGYEYAAADEIERLEVENNRLSKDLKLAVWAESAYCEALEAENKHLRSALVDIADIINPFEEGDVMQEIARFALVAGNNPLQVEGDSNG